MILDNLEYTRLGCYKDVDTDPAIPKLDSNPSSNPWSISGSEPGSNHASNPTSKNDDPFTQCLRSSGGCGYRVFGFKSDHQTCLSSKEAETTYSKHGGPVDCDAAEPNINYVYQIKEGKTINAILAF